MSNNYIVYAAFDDNGVCLYVGEGKPDRYKHITSGVSHVYEANRWHFKNKSISVEILHKDLTKERAVSLEKSEISSRNPSWNKADTIGSNCKDLQEFAVSRLNTFIRENPKFRSKKHTYALLVKDLCKLLNTNGETTLLSSQKWTDTISSSNLTSCLARKEEKSYTAIKYVFDISKTSVHGVYFVKLKEWKCSEEGKDVSCHA